MTDLQFIVVAGHEPIPISADGMEARCHTEFRAWGVRWRGPDRGAPYVQIGPKVVRLVQQGDVYVVPRVKERKKNKKVMNEEFAGKVTLFADPECRRPLSPWLRIETANMSQEDFDEILTDLRSLCFGLSALLRPSGVRPREEHGSGKPSSLLSAWVDAALAAERCLDVYEVQLPRIAANPSRKLRRVRQVVTVERAFRMGKGHLVHRFPEYRRRIALPASEYTTDTPEARFVRASHRILCEEAQAIAGLLRRRLQDEAAAAQEAKDYYDKYRLAARPSTGSGPSVADTGQAQDLADRLEQRVAAAVQRRSAGDEQSRDALLLRTNHLMMSPEYRPVTMAWEAYRRAVPVNASLTELILGLDERSVARTWELYERWVTVRLYTALVEVGFHPPEGEMSLLDLIDIRDGLVKLPGGDTAPLRLTKRCGSANIQLVLRNEPLVYGSVPPAEPGRGYKQPDLTIEATVVETRKRESWVLDAKYKKFYPSNTEHDEAETSEYGSKFLDELVGVAEVKYRQWIKPPVDLSGIIHPTLGAEFTFWDPEQHGAGRPEQCDAPTPHALLAVAVRPGPLGDANVTKLMRLLFGYRLEQPATCWRCGTEGTLRPVNPVTQGRCYDCLRCGSFWIVHWCRSGHEPILKFGRASFHRVEPSDPYNVHCPKCGDYFRGSQQPPGGPAAYDDEEPF